MTDLETLPVWQKLYQVVTSSNGNIISEVVEQVLSICKNYLIKGFLSFKPYSKEAFDEWRKKSTLTVITEDDEMCSFIHRISKELDFDIEIAWSVICNFLIFDYYGKVTELKSIIRYEANIIPILEQLWNFYSCDRMFMLKTLRFIFENYNDKNFIYYEDFQSLVAEINLKQLWDNVLNTFQNILLEINVEKSRKVSDTTLTKWVQRNNREQIELLLFMIQLCDVKELEFKGDELAAVLKLFMQHRFGRHPLFFGAGGRSKLRDIEQIKSAEVGVILSVIRKFWQKPEIFQMLPAEIEIDLDRYTIQGDNSSVLLIWIVFKSTLPNIDIEQCRRCFDSLLNKSAFKSLAKRITSSIFQNCKAGKIVNDSTYIMFTELLKLVDDYKGIYEQPGIPEILCELYKNPQFPSLETLGIFIYVALEIFPYQLDNFLSIVEAIVQSGSNFPKIMTLLQNCPSFCTDKTWPYLSESSTLPEDMHLLPGSDKIIVPAGTPITKCNCFGQNVCKIQIKFDFFIVIEQSIRSLTSFAFNRGDLNTFSTNSFLRCVKFLTFLVKNYHGDFTKDKIITPLIQRLDCVPTFLSRNDSIYFEIFFEYFKVKCALIKHQNVGFLEVFPSAIRNLLFPSRLTSNNVTQKLKFRQLTEDCLVSRFLKEEENLKNHSLLLEYIELIYNILQKDVLHSEILSSGVWYLCYVVFPSHKHWNYDEAKEFQQTEILYKCLQVFVLVLQKDRSKLETDDQRELYDLVHDAFLKDYYIIDNFYGVFVKDKYYIANYMNQESNWISGKTLIILETVKLELLVLLLIYKCRTKTTKECVLDERIHAFARSASTYFISPYNCTLAVLAGKFLDILGRDVHTPLMSCLGVDYDQIQTLFLERLRDPMEDEEVKLNILNIISTCIFYQTGMTAAFFNIQSSKKWYNPHVKRIKADTVGDFMIDYLKNIKKSVTYLRSPLQVGVLKVMADLWECQKQDLIKHVTSSKEFWSLMIEPLLRPFDQSPLVYSNLFKILSLQFNIARNLDGQELFFNAVEKFLTNTKQLKEYQMYVYKIFMNKKLDKEVLNDREMLVLTWTELLLSAQKEKRVQSFVNEETQHYYIELAFDGYTNEIIYTNLLNSWLEFTLVVFEMFGPEFTIEPKELAMKAINYAHVLQIFYENFSLKERKTALAIVLFIVQRLKCYYEKNTIKLLHLLEKIGALVDREYDHLRDDILIKMKTEDIYAKDLIGPWGLILSICNCVLSLENCQALDIWFSNRKYLEKLTLNVCDLLSHKDSFAAGILSLHSLNLYVQSNLFSHFLDVNMMLFFDRLEPVCNALLTGSTTKVNVLDLVNAWRILNLVVKFNQEYLRKFQKTALPACFAFLILNQHILKHILRLPENTVNLEALNLVMQTLMFYNELLKKFKSEWYRKNNNSYTFMTEGIRKVINACIYLCLRPKHIGFYTLDDYYRLTSCDLDASFTNDLMVLVINKLIGILGLAFSCLYKLNPTMLEMFDYYDPSEPLNVLIHNDFSVPRFELPIPCDLTYGKLLCLAHFMCKILNQLHQKQNGPRENIDADKFKKYMGLVEHQDPSDFMPEQKLSSFLRYLYEYSGLTDPWINKLDPDNTLITADILMLFIAQQTTLTIKFMDFRQASYYKRNLYSELQFFHEYIRKRTSELMLPSSSTNQMYSGDMDYMKKYLLSHWRKDQTGKNKIDKVAEENFMLIVSFWFSNICQIQ
ncbi:hypothetical protein ABEB36_011353 [Hypothenemus hampei]|uniref:Uncharacterized protein n=1 Tax=Hypothenemus hampei TaxID=57062 RepID=A0ABD1EF43_HYPHA